MVQDAEALAMVEASRDLAKAHAKTYAVRLTELVPEEGPAFSYAWEGLDSAINEMAELASATLEARPV